MRHERDPIQVASESGWAWAPGAWHTAGSSRSVSKQNLLNRSLTCLSWGNVTSVIPAILTCSTWTHSPGTFSNYPIIPIFKIFSKPSTDLTILAKDHVLFRPQHLELKWLPPQFPHFWRWKTAPPELQIMHKHRGLVCVGLTFLYQLHWAALTFPKISFVRNNKCKWHSL